MYFAVNSDIALSYSHPPDPHTGYKTLLFCDVLIGMFTKGVKDSVMPPPIPGYPRLPNFDDYLYDSTVDAISNPKIYVSCYKGNLYAFPTYIITVRKVNL